MSFSVKKSVPTPLELHYAELKKQSVIDRNKAQTKNEKKERHSGGIGDEAKPSPMQTGIEDPTKRKPSQSVTPDEMQALRSKFSVYA